MVGMQSVDREVPMSQDDLHVILKRRSIRRFTGEPVGRDRIALALQAAMAAPSANNARPWQFVVVTDREKIAALCSEHPYAAFGQDAGAIIFPCGVKAEFKWFDQDMAAATENLLLAVAHLGLGATWCGMDDSKQEVFRGLLGVPDNVYLFALIPVGIPAEEKPARTQYEENRVHWEAYRS
jgi:nitroreductase